MKFRLNSIIAALAALTALLSFTLALSAQSGGQAPAATPGAAAPAGARGRAPAGPPQEGSRGRGGQIIPTGPAPKLANGKPDFSGIWFRPYTPNMLAAGLEGGTSKLPYTEWGQKHAPKAEGGNYDPGDPEIGDYTGSCMPFGFIRSINSPHPMQIVQNSDYISFLFEQNTWFVVIPTDGRAHPKGSELNPTWFGDSVAHWEGETLVIDTIGFNGYTRLDTNGHPHSDQLHLTQKFKRLNLGVIEYSITIEDPKAYTTTWTQSRYFENQPTERVMEYSCEEGNKDLYEGVIRPWKPPVD